MFKWYSYGFSKFFVLRGRAGRAEFWSFVAVSLGVPFFVSLFYAIAIGIMSDENTVEVAGEVALANPLLSMGPFFYTVLSIWGVLNIPPSIAVTVRRLHDRDHTGWWVFWSFFFPILEFVILVFVLLKSEPFPNKYGVRAPTSPNDLVQHYYQNQAQMYSVAQTGYQYPTQSPLPPRPDTTTIQPNTNQPPSNSSH